MDKSRKDNYGVSINEELLKAKEVDARSLSGRHSFEPPDSRRTITSTRLNNYIQNFFTEGRSALDPALKDEIKREVHNRITPTEAAEIVSRKVIEPLLRAMDTNRDGFITLKEAKTYYKHHPETPFIYARDGHFFSDLKPSR
jgi:hypothetical protein